MSEGQSRPANIEEIESVKALLDQLTLDVGKLSLSANDFTTKAELADTGSTNAEILYKRVEDHMSIAQEQLSAALACLTWAADQQQYPSDSLTGLFDKAPLTREIQPTAHFWKGPPVWKIVNDPIEGTDGETWYLFINEEAKAQCRFEVAVYAKWGQAGVWDRHPIPIYDDIELPSDAPEWRWTVAQWADFAKSKAEPYIAAHGLIEAHGLSGRFAHYQTLSRDQWKEPAEEDAAYYS